uniref:NADH dehydrogenase subunit 4L n=1 Tax=Sphaeropleales sp. YC001 TaxID=1715688 RepID=A0A0N7F123_9CHLO|nr:NADH dehydrogenase subunit 4L [Sphaeropleales sp. YC001]
MSSGMFLCTTFVLFGMGALGTFLNRRNFLIMILCIEVMLLSVNLVFLNASVSVDDVNGQLMALWVLTAAAAETALGLALCVLYFRLRSTLDVELISLMKG